MTITTHPDNNTQLSRRRLLTKGGASVGVLGAAATAGILLNNKADASPTNKTVRFDVACLGDTLRVVFAPGAQESGDLRGSTFSVEGSLYNPGTISADGFDPSRVEPVGHWFCRGWYLIEGNRPEPHVITTQEYLFGRITESDLFPADQMTSSGVEGSNDEKQLVTRSITGGAGKYAGARGEARQRGRGFNTTELAGLGLPAPNFTFELRLIGVES